MRAVGIPHSDITTSLILRLSRHIHIRRASLTTVILPTDMESDEHDVVMLPSEVAMSVEAQSFDRLAGHITDDALSSSSSSSSSSLSLSTPTIPTTTTHTHVTTVDKSLSSYVFANAIESCIDKDSDSQRCMQLLEKASSLHMADEVVFLAAAKCCARHREYSQAFDVIQVSV